MAAPLKQNPTLMDLEVLAQRAEFRRDEIRAALQLLKKARLLLAHAKSPAPLADVRSAIKRTANAVRHAENHASHWRLVFSCSHRDAKEAS